MDDRGREIILIHFGSHMQAVVYAAFFSFPLSPASAGVSVAGWTWMFFSLSCVVSPGLEDWVGLVDGAVERCVVGLGDDVDVQGILDLEVDY